MSDIDALIEKLGNACCNGKQMDKTGCTCDGETASPHVLLAWDAAAALERMRDENKDLDNKLTAQFCMRLAAEAEVARLREALQVAETALDENDQLIRHQYSGSREAMSDLTYANQAAEDALAVIRAALASAGEVQADE